MAGGKSVKLVQPSAGEDSFEDLDAVLARVKDGICRNKSFCYNKALCASTHSLLWDRFAVLARPNGGER